MQKNIPLFCIHQIGFSNNIIRALIHPEGYKFKNLSPDRQALHYSATKPNKEPSYTTFALENSTAR